MQALWRLRLSREVILEQALRIVEEEGITALTMRRLAVDLRAKASSFYNYFPDKKSLLADLADIFTDRLEHHPDPGAAWQDRMRVFAHSFANITLEHPAAEQLIQVYARRERITPHFEIELEALVQAGFTPNDALNVFMTVITFSIG